MTKIRALGVAYLACSVAGTAIAIATEDGPRFASIDMSTGDVGRDFVVGAGTALSAPLVLLVAFGALIALTGSKHRERVLPLIAVAGVLFAVGQLGEPITTETLTSPLTHPATTGVVVANVVLPVVMSMVALRSLRQRRPAESVVR